MDEVVPYFFFSYSQGDTDDYLDRFFEDLRKRVADLSGLAINDTDHDRREMLNRVGFRDDYGVTTGEDWKEKIGAAIQRNGVLVCIYSPNFFSRRQPKQFCAREFTAFLNRDPQIRYARGTGRPDEEFQLIRAPRHILPILWRKLRHLQNEGLPPYVMRAIKFALDMSSVSREVNSFYLENGMRRISMDRTSGEYDDILDYFAGSIAELRKHPLPPLPSVPDIMGLRNAFWDPPEDDKIDRATTAAAVPEVIVASASWGPTRMLVIEVRHASTADWAPYAGESIPALFEQVANQEELATDWLALDPSAPDFMDRMRDELLTAAENSVRAVVVVDPLCLTHDISKKMRELLKQQFRAGLLLPADSADQAAIHLIEQFCGLLKHEGYAPDYWVVRESVGDVAQFRTAVSSVSSEIRARIVDADPVRRRPPDNDGPTMLPRISNR